jgi:hypothetical protein
MNVRPDSGRAGSWREVLLASVCVAGGLLFFFSLERLWPLADIDLVVDARQLQTEARGFLEARGFELDGFASASRLAVDTAVLDYLERSFGTGSTSRSVATRGRIPSSCTPRSESPAGIAGSKRTIRGRASRRNRRGN